MKNSSENSSKNSSENSSKNIKIIALCVAIVVILCIAGIWAYFTDTATVTNHVKMGIVDIELKEYTLDENGNKIEWKNTENVLPGETISKIPEITCAKGSADCYVRAKVAIKAKNENLMNDEEMLTLDNVNVDKDKWYYCEQDGYFYYKEILTDKSGSVTLFTEVDVPSQWENKWALEEFTIDVVVDAIQSKNFTPDFNQNSAEPWPGITKDDIQECIYPNHTKE